MPLMNTIRLSSVWLLACVLTIPAVCVLLPDLIVRHGMLALGLWVLRHHRQSSPRF